MTPRRKSRKSNPAIFVFCEGETEQRYIDVLRRHFRVPIQIITKVLNTRISQRLVDNYVKKCGYPDIDRVYLFYDGDRQDVVDRLFSMRNAEVMLSCPCVELWYLLHFTNHRSYVSSDSIVKLLIKHYPTYKKGEIQSPMQEILISSWKTAASRAKALMPKSNPSTSVYLLLEYLESIKNS